MKRTALLAILLLLLSAPAAFAEGEQSVKEG
jgi:hypothetical protein